MPPRSLRPLGRPVRHYICPSCRPCSRAYTTSTSTLPAQPPSAGFTPLTSRTLLSVTGVDAAKFLHGLTTSTITPTSPAHYTGFLNAQGRLLHDVFLLPTEDGFLLDVSTASFPQLLSHLKRHKLRSKVTLRPVGDDLSILALWSDERWTPHSPPLKAAEGVMAQVLDARAPGMGRRVVVRRGQEDAATEGLELATEDQYRIRRYERGVPEGQDELPREDVLPFNANLDVMGAVDFKKGCYVGQELTIRTHHTGVVRRRVLPVVLYGEGEEVPAANGYDPNWAEGQVGKDADLKVVGKRGRPGKWIAGVGNVGLAMCRLEMMTDLAVTNEPSGFDAGDRFVVETDGGKQVGVKAFVPDWLRGRVRAPKVQKRVE